MTSWNDSAADLSNVDAVVTTTAPLPGSPGGKSKREGWSFLASLVAHLAFGFIVLTFIPSVPKFVPADDESIAVEMVPPQEADPAVQPPIVIEHAAPVPDTPAVQRQEADRVRAGELPTVGEGDVDETRMVSASQLYAEKVLAAPKSKNIREALRKLANEEHMVQLCNIEAMEQVSRWNRTFQPDYVVAYAMSDPRMAPTAIEAEGGAFRSRRRWYNIRFKCAVTADIGKVVSFAFAVGSEIPKHEWRGHNLAPDDGPDD